MKIETILNAYDDARYKYYQYYHQYGHAKRERQYNTFRDRIIRMDERNKMEIERLRNYIGLNYLKDWDTPEEVETWKDL